MQERLEEEERLRLEEEAEVRQLLYEKWKKQKYCEELMKQAHDYRLSHHNEMMEERHLDEVHLKEILHAEIRREKQYNSTISLYYYSYGLESQIIT